MSHLFDNKDGFAHFFYKLSIYALIVTVLLGLVLRFSYADLIGPLVSDFDLRRVHTHIGFYLFLFPWLWMWWQKKNLWVPKGVVLLSYWITASIALLSFLFFSYHWLSKVISFFVLLYWLVFVIKNLWDPKLKEQKWCKQILYGILFASLSVGTIAYYGMQGKEEMARTLVRVFLTFVVWGIFVPFSLARILANHNQVKDFPNWLWSLLLVLMAGFMWKDQLSFLAIGPVGLGIVLTYLIFYFQKDWRFVVYWLVIAMGLLGLGFGFISNSHATAVAGFHFLVLGPILQSLLPKLKAPFSHIYDLSLYIMIVAILLTGIEFKHYLLWQKFASYSSLSLVLVLVFQVSRIRRG